VCFYKRCDELPVFLEIDHKKICRMVKEQSVCLCIMTIVNGLTSEILGFR
jgi:hypothetical protein